MAVSPVERDRAFDAVFADHEHRCRRGRGLEPLRPLDEGRHAADVALLQPLVDLERHLGRSDQSPPRSLAFSRITDPSSFAIAVSACSRRSWSSAESENSKWFGAQTSLTPDGAPGVHLLDQTLRELDRLHAGTERLGEEALHEAPQTSFEVAEIGHRRAHGACGSPVPGAYVTPEVAVCRRLLSVAAGPCSASGFEKPNRSSGGSLPHRHSRSSQ